MNKPETSTPTQPYSRPDTREFLKDLIGITWEDNDNLPEEASVNYAKAAESILLSSPWQNETKRLMDTLIRGMATEAESYEQLRDIRMCVSALKLIDQRLKEIASRAGRAQKATDPFEAI